MDARIVLVIIPLPAEQDLPTGSGMAIARRVYGFAFFFPAFFGALPGAGFVVG